MPSPGNAGGRGDGRLAVFAVGASLTLLVALSTYFTVPSDPDWRTASYVLIGLLVTLGAAFWTERGQGQILGRQDEIRDLLMEKVNSRQERTKAVIALCKQARVEFRAVTFFPVVGVQDDPRSAPGEFLSVLEKRLLKRVKVTLVSVSFMEAREFAKARDFDPDSLQALDWIENRLNELRARFSERLTIVTVPGTAITVNVCHNERAALLYSMNPTSDKGHGFKSKDDLIREIVRDGAARYASYRERERHLPLGSQLARLKRSSRQNSDS